jgi:hypothetical protein
MESAAAAQEAVPVREDAAPGLAGEAGVDQVHWLFHGEAHEDLLDELLRQRRRHASRRWVGTGGIETTARTYVGSESLYISIYMAQKSEQQVRTPDAIRWILQFQGQSDRSSTDFGSEPDALMMISGSEWCKTIDPTQMAIMVCRKGESTLENNFVINVYKFQS